MAINRSAPKRYGPPRNAKPVGWRDLAVGDFAYVSGYWFRIDRIFQDPITARERLFEISRPESVPCGGRMTSTLYSSPRFAR